MKVEWIEEGGGCWVMVGEEVNCESEDTERKDYRTSRSEKIKCIYMVKNLKL